jgi:hypothetical protein
MKVQIIQSTDVAACPKGSLLPGHYRPDGTCFCFTRGGFRITTAMKEILRTHKRRRLALAKAARFGDRILRASLTLPVETKLALADLLTEDTQDGVGDL